MKRDQNKRPDGKKGFPGLLLLFIVGLVVILAFQNLSENRMANVSFSHQIEHLVNLDLLNEGHSRKTSLNEGLVSFTGLFRENLSETSKDRFRFLKLLSQSHELQGSKERSTSELNSLYRDAYNSVAYYLLISGQKVPYGGYVVVGKGQDTHESSNSLIITEPYKASDSTVTLVQAKNQLNALVSERNPDKLMEAGLLLGTLITEFRSPQLSIGNENLKNQLAVAEKALNLASNDQSLNHKEKLAAYSAIFMQVESVSLQIGNVIDQVRCSDLRGVREFQVQLGKNQTINTEYRKNALQLSKAKGKVAAVSWYYGNKEISTNELEKKNPEEFQRWFLNAEAEWLAFDVNKGTPFKAPDQPRSLVLDKTFKTEEPAPNYFSYLFTFMPILLVGLLLYFIFTRQMKGGGSSAMNFGKSPAKLLPKNAQSVTFDDVAGITEAKEELEEVVEFLKDPRRFKSLGAKIPKGVLLSGSPGTGKTLIARAVAGEAGVPFFSISGSDFVEMFVGVGASRVRDLFEQARKNAPCIIFIDEIDAVGRHRGGGMGGGHDEREQTLNQLLVEVDGMEATEGVIIIAATNRPDVLDKALLRPGRFDRSVIFELPDLKGRLEILKVHIRNIKIGEDVNLVEIAASTAGSSGADLANLLNEAALLAAKRWSKTVNHEHIKQARDKVSFGKERRSLVLTQEDKITTAYHEAGHALIALILKSTDDVTYVTIIPRGQSLGATHFVPKQNRVSYKYSELVVKLIVLMGGRVAEELVNGDPTNGASGDFKMATAYAKSMVTEWGMSEKVGNISFADDGQNSLMAGFHEREHSEETALIIDQEVKRFIDEAYAEAQKILKENFDKMKLIADMLLKYESLDAQDLADIMDDVFSEDKKKQKIEDFLGAKRPVPALPKSLASKQKKLRESMA